MNIALVEYGAGNLPSVERALTRLGVESRRASTPEAIREVDAQAPHIISQADYGDDK